MRSLEICLDEVLVTEEFQLIHNLCSLTTSSILQFCSCILDSSPP